MYKFVMGLIGLSALSFVLAVIAALTGAVLTIQPESFSRACSNLALIAIAITLVMRETPRAK